MKECDRGAVALSVVVPTFNRRPRLEKVLQSLALQDIVEPFQVVVVSDGSTDDTDQYLVSGDVPIPVLALRPPNGGPAAARNLGVERATGELVVFLDDDVVADRSLLRSHLEAHRRLGDHAVVVGPMLNPPDHPMSVWVHWEQRMLAKQYTAMNDGLYEATPRQFYTGNASMRVDHFRSAGGFNTSFRRAEDVELAFRLADFGLKFHFEPAAVGLHYADRPYEAWKRTAYDYGQNDAVFARDMGHTWMFGFVKDAFVRQHPALRWVVLRSIRSRGWRRRSTQLFELIIQPKRADRNVLPRSVVQYALSGVYAIEYYNGMADELGSPDALTHVIRFGQPLPDPAGSPSPP